MMTPGQKVSRRAALGLIGGGAALPRLACAGPARMLGGGAFGTSWTMTTPDPTDTARLGSAIDALFARINLVFSPWRSDSAISAFNAGPAQTLANAPDLVHVAAAALDIARLSHGTFDPTIGPLVARWGFGPIHGGGAPDWRGLTRGPGQLTKVRGDLTLDLCGIAKGWALDRAAALVTNAGHGNMLFELGGEFVALGQHPDGRDWHLAVQAPVPGHPAPAVLAVPPGSAVATSGSRAQSYRLGPHRYGHIIDPETGAPVQGTLRSVTVVAEDAMTADGWATALFAAGDGDGPTLARARDIAALFLFEEGATLRQVRTGFINEILL